MSEPGHPGRTTVLVGLLLSLLLAVAYAITSRTGTLTEPRAEPAPLPPFPTVASQTPPPATPQPGADHPVRKVGALEDDRSVLLNGRGNADLRYRRAPRNGTRVHFICTGCDADTWLVEQPRGNPVGGGALADPADVIGAVDTVEPVGTTNLLVKAPPRARWTVTLTPFDAVPVHEQTFDALGDTWSPSVPARTCRSGAAAPPSSAPWPAGRAPRSTRWSSSARRTAPEPGRSRRPRARTR